MTQVPAKKRTRFTILPNIVFSPAYDLDNQQLAFYARLKMICGEDGTCYRTLLSLSRLTKFSTGQLSEMIRHLHQIGLIHAEKKKRGDRGWPIWHISIVDVWGKNFSQPQPPGGGGETNDSTDEASEENASQNEHTHEDREEIVHGMNELEETLHNMNKELQQVNQSPENASPAEASRSPNGAQNQESRTKNSNDEQDSHQQDKAPFGAIVDSSLVKNEEEDDPFAWSIGGILNLAALHLPPLPHYRAKSARSEAEAAQLEAAGRIFADSGLRLMGPGYLVRLMHYMSDADSPCSWLAWYHKHYPKATVKLGHVIDNAERCGPEMIARNWLPPRIQEDDPGWAPDSRTAVEIAGAQDDHQGDPDPDPNTVPSAESEQSESAESERAKASVMWDPRGMSDFDADCLVDRIRRDRSLFCVEKRRSNTGGTIVEVTDRPGHTTQLLRPDDWQTLLSSLVPTLSLRERLERHRQQREQLAG